MFRKFFVSNIKGTSTIHLLDIALILIYIVPIFNAYSNSVRLITSLFVLLMISILWSNERFFLVLPIFIFYSSNLVVLGAIRIFDIYIALFMLKILTDKKLILNKNLIMPLIIIIIHSLLVVANKNIRTAMVIISSFIFVVLYISRFFNNKNNLKGFINYFIYATLSASLFGMIKFSTQVESYIVIDGVLKIITRNVGTFSDPNYFGFFINIAIFSALIFNKSHTKKKAFLIMIMLYISLISTISFTALICNAIGIVLYIIFNKENKLNNILLVLVGIIILIIIFNISNEYNIPYVSDLSHRIKSKMIGTNSYNLDEFTTNRSHIWRLHLNYFVEQPLWKIFFGGNFLTDYGFDSQFNSVSHQSFIDLLLNFGIVGTFILMYNFLSRTLKIIIRYNKEKTNELLVLIFIKYIWFFYAFGMSMYPAWIFNIFFLI